MNEGAAIGFDDNGNAVPIALPDSVESPEVELIGLLKEAGAVFPDEAGALEIARAFVTERNATSAGFKFTPSQIVSAIVDGSSDCVEGFGRAMVFAFMMQLPCAPKNKTDFALRLEIPKNRERISLSTAKRLWTDILQYSQGCFDGS